MGIGEKEKALFEKKGVWPSIRRRFLKVMAWIENAHSGKSFCRG